MKEPILKLTLSLLAALLCFGLQSCSNDNEDEPIPPSDISKIIVGNWISETYYQSTNPYVDAMDINDTSLHDGYNQKFIYTFYEDGHGYRSNPDSDFFPHRAEFTWVVYEGSLYIGDGLLTDVFSIYKAGKNVFYTKDCIEGGPDVAYSKFVRRS